MKDNGGPAFPSNPSKDVFANTGMTLRDYFAAKAMERCPLNGCNDAAQWCYQRADAMLKERAK